MPSLRRWIAYDWFKLAVALILLMLWVVFPRPPAVVSPAPAFNLPAYPWAGFTWRLDEAAKTLSDPNGVPLYRLSADGSLWQPVIPSDIQIKLPEGCQTVQNAFGGWELRDSSGRLLFSWDTEAFIWTTPPEPTATVPTLAPTSTATAPPTPASAPAPTAAAGTLIPPAAPTAIPTLAPTATRAPTLAPTATPTLPPAGCSAPAPARLTVGKTARVTSNLNLRREPVISDNIVMVNPVGAVLKVLQGPQCVEYQGSAYLWWQVESPDGTVGWSAEATLNGAFYFLEPIP